MTAIQFFFSFWNEICNKLLNIIILIFSGTVGTVQCWCGPVSQRWDSLVGETKMMKAYLVQYQRPVLLTQALKIDLDAPWVKKMAAPLIQALKVRMEMLICSTLFNKGAYLELTREIIWNICQSFIWHSIYFSLNVKSRSNMFLEPTSTKQWVYTCF